VFCPPLLREQPVWFTDFTINISIVFIYIPLFICCHSQPIILRSFTSTLVWLSLCTSPLHGIIMDVGLRLPLWYNDWLGKQHLSEILLNGSGTPVRISKLGIRNLGAERPLPYFRNILKFCFGGIFCALSLTVNSPQLK
jgi:hypothetical protein